MNPAVHAIVLMLLLLPLYAADIIRSEPVTPSDQNRTIESNASAYDQNDTNRTYTPDYPIGNNWFYYRNFLANMDAVYKYGTDAVIMVGSGIDYYLYQLLSSDANSTEQASVDLAAGKDKNATALPQKVQPSENNKNIKQSVPSQKADKTFPLQLASQNKHKGEKTYLLSETFSEKTVTIEFLDKTNSSYLRLRGGYAYDYRGEGNYIYSIDGQVMIPRTQRRYHLIIGDDTKNSSDLSVQGTSAERDKSIALGVNDLFGLFYPIESKIRFGFSGATNPYGKVAFGYEALLGTWLMVPSQTFRYSRKEEFNEWTNLDFRRKIADQTMFSLLFQRSTITEIDGMNYFMQPSVSFALGKYGSLTSYFGIYGRTIEQPEDTDGYKPIKGVYRYAFGINWSKKASRKYIVYRLQPILSYDDKYAFRPNYSVQVLLEFYFGLRD